MTDPWQELFDRVAGRWGWPLTEFQKEFAEEIEELHRRFPFLKNVAQSNEKDMAEFTKQTTTTTREEYVLPTPTSFDELMKLITVVRGDATNTEPMVEVRDNKIVIWREVTE